MEKLKIHISRFDNGNLRIGGSNDSKEVFKTNKDSRY